MWVMIIARVKVRDRVRIRVRVRVRVKVRDRVRVRGGGDVTPLTRFARGATPGVQENPVKDKKTRENTKGQYKNNRTLLMAKRQERIQKNCKNNQTLLMTKRQERIQKASTKTTELC